LQSQKKIEEIIRQRAVAQSYEDAVEYHVRRPTRHLIPVEGDVNG
jgi:hypothetical protein